MESPVGTLKYLLIFLGLLAPVVPANAQGVSFHVSSVPTIVPLQDSSEPLGLISLAATTGGVIKAGSTFSIAYGVANLLPTAPGTVACSQPSCNAALKLTSAGNVATVTTTSDIAFSAGDLVCVFQFLFSATQFGLGTVTANVSAVSSAPATNPVALIGSAQVQVASVPAATTAVLASTSLSFGNVAVGSSSQPRPSNLINFGSGPLNITSIVASPNVFTQTNNCPASLPGGQQQCTITVTFTPTALATVATGFIAITDDGPGSPQIITLTGIGVAASTTSPASVASMAQIAAGAGWRTQLTLLNTGTTSANAQAQFFDNNGNPLSLSVTLPQSPSTPAQQTATVSQTLAAGTMFLIQLNEPAGQATQVGSGRLTTSGSVSGFAVFDYDPTGQEAVVPLETRNAGMYILAFDNTNGLATGVALANESSQAANITVILLDDTGAPIGTNAISLAAAGHTSFMLAQSYPATAGKRGMAEFVTPSGGQISLLGLRANGNAITTVPILTQ